MNLTEHQSNKLTKLLAIGDPKSGKTGSLTSLVAAGYKLRVLDMDNLLDTLKYYVMKECREKAKNVDFLTFRDQYKASADGPVIDGMPEAFEKALKALDNWPGLGKPKDWGEDTILVIDSLTRFSDSAFIHFEAMTQRQSRGKYDNRAVFFTAQRAVEKCLATITGAGFSTNIIVIAHVLYIDMPDGTKKGFPLSIGQALSPKIASYFPSVVLYSNDGGKRTIRTNSTPLIDLANPKPFAVSPTYSIETGLAEIFEVLREQKVTTIRRKA
jgi:hypothetical protein